MSHHHSNTSTVTDLNSLNLDGDDVDTSINSDSPPYDHLADYVDSPIPFDSPLDDDVITFLLSTEHHHMPNQHLLRQPPVDTFRLDSVKWILKVNALYYFKPVTAYLAVNYFDRFLSLQSRWVSRCGWLYQLLAVACISLAAKMEEPYVPLLIDLQVCKPSFNFDPITIQRMELLVMANLNWQLRAVTPFVYLHYFISKLFPSFGCQLDPFSDIVWLSSDLIVNTTRVNYFLGFAPSVMAAAAVISAVGEGVDIPESFYERVNKEMVRSCHKIMEEYLVDTCRLALQKVRRIGGASCLVECKRRSQSASSVLNAMANRNNVARSVNSNDKLDNKQL